MKVSRVLFVCTGNTCRSPMAAGLLRHLWHEAAPGWELEVRSAGTGAFPGLKASDHAVAVLKDRGIDISDHRSQAVTPELVAESDLILTMTQRHKEQLLRLFPEAEGKVFSLGEYAGQGADVPDPFGGSQEEYRATAGQLEQYVRQVIERLIREGNAE